MIPDPMARLREMAPDGVEWFAGDNIGYAWFVNPPKHKCAWMAPGKFNTTGWRARTPTTPFALNLRTGAAKFPDGTTIPARDWMRFYRARVGGVNEHGQRDCGFCPKGRRMLGDASIDTAMRTAIATLVQP